VKVEIKEPSAITKKEAKVLKPGEFGRGQVTGQLYAGTDEGVLVFPGMCTERITVNHDPDLIDKLPPGTKITITV
jgi:hypothetical protein